MHDDLQSALMELKGKTPDQIHALMVERGVKGVPGTTGKCPLTMFFSNTHTGRFIVGREFIIHLSGNGYQDKEKAVTPKNLSAFIGRMDRGDYPDLIQLPPRCQPKRKRAKDPRKGDRHKDRPTSNRKRIHNFAKEVGRFTHE